MPDSRLVRFVLGPDGLVVPDIAAKLPGRGLWVTAESEVLHLAIARNLFAKAAKASIYAPSDLIGRVTGLLVARLQDHLGLARRSGAVVFGFDTVERALAGNRKVQLLMHARDGSDDGLRKLIATARARGSKPEVLRGLTCEELSVALGRENVVHAALFPGPLADRLALDAKRLEGFRPLEEGKRAASEPVRDERQE